MPLPMWAFCILLCQVPGEQPSELAITYLPDKVLVPDLVADPIEMRPHMGYRRLQFVRNAPPGVLRGDANSFADTGAAYSLDLFSIRATAKTRVHIGALFGVASMFDFDTRSDDLLSGDFFLGVPLSLQRGSFAGRLRLYHQSSHVGDEALLNDQRVVSNGLSMELADLILTWQRDRWRLYAGGGYILRTTPAMKRVRLQAGGELRFRRLWSSQEAGTWLPIMAIDEKAIAEPRWQHSVHIAAGFEWKGESARRRLRILVNFLAGTYPFGQRFFEQRARGFGFEFQVVP